MLCYSIAAAKLAGIEKIWVSTDSKKYAEIAKKFEAEVPFLRSPEISSDKSTDYEFMNHAMKWHEENFDNIPEYWVHLRPTTPLRDPKVIRDAIRTMMDSNYIDSLRSAHEVPESPFKWFLKDENNLFKGLRDNLTPEQANAPRQSFPKVYNPNGYIDIVKSSHVLNHKNLHGENMYVFETPQCNEIDTLEDFEYLDYKLRESNSPLNGYLRSF